MSLSSNYPTPSLSTSSDACFFFLAQSNTHSPTGGPGPYPSPVEAKSYPHPGPSSVAIARLTMSSQKYYVSTDGISIVSQRSPFTSLTSKWTTARAGRHLTEGMPWYSKIIPSSDTPYAPVKWLARPTGWFTEAWGGTQHQSIIIKKGLTPRLSHTTAMTMSPKGADSVSPSMTLKWQRHLLSGKHSAPLHEAHLWLTVSDHGIR